MRMNFASEDRPGIRRTRLPSRCFHSVLDTMAKTRHRICLHDDCCLVLSVHMCFRIRTQFSTWLVIKWIIWILVSNGCWQRAACLSILLVNTVKTFCWKQMQLIWYHKCECWWNNRGPNKDNPEMLYAWAYARSVEDNKQLET